MSDVELLPAPGTRPRVRRHEDSAAGAVAAGMKCALAALYQPIALQCGGVLAQIPDVASSVLGVVVVGPLGHAALLEDAVEDHGCADALDELGPLGDDEHVLG